MNSERRFSEIAKQYLLLVLGLLFMVQCGALEDVRPRTMFGEGVEESADGKLVLYLNVGVLTGRSEKLYSREAVESWLNEAAEALEQSYPDVQYRFIVDQPQDTEFITARAVRRNRLPLLSPFPLRDSQKAKEVYLFRLAISPVLWAISERVISGVSGIPALDRNTGYAKLPKLDALNQAWRAAAGLDESDPEIHSYQFLTFWQSYSYSQIHYDIVLTDTAVLPDDAHNLKTEPFTVASSYLLPAPGRPALDRIAVLISILPPGDNREEMLERIQKGLEKLTFPGLTGSSEILRQQRIDVLRSLHDFHQKGKNVGCEAWNRSSHYYGEGLIGLDPIIAELLKENLRNMSRLCTD